MGFVLSILYLLTCYLTPGVLFGPLADLRIELILAVLLLIVSIPVLSGSIILKTSQSIALIGLATATFLSEAIGAHWTSGGISAVFQFLPNLFGFFIICLHCNSKRKAQTVIALLVFVCVFVIAQGAMEMHRGLPATEEASALAGDSSYFYGMNNEQGQWFYRLRGMGQIHDPNDFAQLIVCTLPLLFFFWRKKSLVRNFFLVLIPGALLLWGAYLTHSRGSILALLAIVVVALRRRIGTVPSILLAGALFAGASALHFAGGREISASAGEDRTELWGDGLELLKSHPLFGVGLGNMPDYIGKTAHNTIVVCAAELGACGLFFWSMFLLPSIRDVLVFAFPKKPRRATSMALGPGVADPVAAIETVTPGDDEIIRFGRLLVYAFTGFLVTGWFLSRAYILLLFVLGGLAEVTFQMAADRGMAVSRLPFVRVLRYSVLLMFGFILLMYILLRVVNLTH